MTAIYLRWDINAEVLLYPTTHFKTPAITFCFNLSSSSISNCTSKEDCAILKSSRAFFNNTLQLEDIFPVAAYADANGQPIKMFDKASLRPFRKLTTTRYKIEDIACYHVDYMKALNGSQHSQRSLRNMGTGWIVGFGMNDEKSISNTHFGPLVGFTSRGVMMDTMTQASPHGFKRDHMQIVEYKRTELRLLPPPYSTNCRDYTKTGFKSQFDCLQRCAIRESLAKTGAYPQRIPLAEDQDDHKLAESVAFDADFFSDECDRKCKQIDCRFELFESEVALSAYIGDWAVFVSAVYALRLPRVPDLIVNYEPLMIFAGYLAMMASIVSLWLGLSVYSLFDIYWRVVQLKRL